MGLFQLAQAQVDPWQTGPRNGMNSGMWTAGNPLLSWGLICHPCCNPPHALFHSLPSLSQPLCTSALLSRDLTFSRALSPCLLSPSFSMLTSCCCKGLYGTFTTASIGATHAAEDCAVRSYCAVRSFFYEFATQVNVASRFLSMHYRKASFCVF